MMPGLRILAMLGLLVVLFVVGQAMRLDFMGPLQIANQLKIAAFLGLFGLCQTIVIAAGGQGLDLSAAAALGATDGATVIGIVCAALAGLAAGLCNGVGAALMGIPLLVTTLAVASVIDGRLILGVSTLYPANSASPALVELSGLTSVGS